MYRLSAAAHEDMWNIYQWGYELFGEAQADRYFYQLHSLFERVGNNPHHYPEVDYILPGVRRAVHEAHSVYFMHDIVENTVLIIGVLSKQDAINRLR